MGNCNKFIDVGLAKLSEAFCELLGYVADLKVFLIKDLSFIWNTEIEKFGKLRMFVRSDSDTMCLTIQQLKVL